MKKDKKANQDTAPKKNYQQEVDPDVKQKNKSKTAVIVIVAFIAVFFLALLIWYISGNSVKEEHYDVEGQTAQAVVAQGEESQEDVITVDESLLDLTQESVKVTIPLAYYQDNAPSDVLDENQLASGYLDAEIVDGNIVYTIKTSYYPSVVENLYEYYDTLANDYEKKNKILLISSNRRADLFTVTIEKLNFAPNAHRNMMTELYYNAAIYQCYLGVAQPKVAFQFKYLGEQFPFVNYQYPDCIGKDLSAYAVEKETTTSAVSEQAQ